MRGATAASSRIFLPRAACSHYTFLLPLSLLRGVGWRPAPAARPAAMALSAFRSQYRAPSRTTLEYVNEIKKSHILLAHFNQIQDSAPASERVKDSL